MNTNVIPAGGVGAGMVPAAGHYGQWGSFPSQWQQGLWTVNMTVGPRVSAQDTAAPSSSVTEIPETHLANTVIGCF